MRLKANKHGYSLNQRGLYAGVVRDPRDRQKKVCEGGYLETISTETAFDGVANRFFQDILSHRKPRKRFSESWVRVLSLLFC